MPGKLYKAAEVADLLGLKLDTIYRYARAGELSGLKLGKLWRFAERDVEEFIAKRRQNPAVPTGNTQRLPDILKGTANGGIVTADADISCRDLDLRSDRLAHALAQAGLRAGDRVVIVLPHSAEFVIACFAIWKLGAVVVPEDSTTHPDTLHHIIGETMPTALIIDRSTAAQLAAKPDVLSEVRVAWIKDSAFALPGLPIADIQSLDSALDHNVRFETPDYAGSREDVVSITYTSGSTGLPKGVMHTHDSWLAAADFTRENAEISPHDQIVIPLPLHHAYAFRQILAYLMAGAKIILATDIYQALKLLRRHRPNALLLVPAAANILIDHFGELLRDADAFLKYIEIGTAPLPPSRLQKLQELLPTTQIHLPYGLTEARVAFLDAGPDGSLNRICDVSPELEIRIGDESGKSVDLGQSGEIMLRGRGLFAGYWREPSSGGAVLADEWFPTGDLGRLDSSGGVVLLGRKDDVLKVGGRKVSPFEVEAALEKHPAISESAVIGRPDPRGLMEWELHAFVVSRQGVAPDESELLEHCRQQLASHKVPARIHLRTSLPKSPIGKIQRNLLETTTNTDH